MHNSNYALEVLVNGRPATEYYKDGKSFTEAREGSEYTLRFRNNSWKRVLAIFSVDGVEVLKGKAAAQAENGYIVDAFSSVEIKGYRIDEENVAAFKFTGGQLSYAVTVGAAKTTPSGETVHEKTDRNNGVIGVRVFEEDVPVKDYAATYKKLPIATLGASRMVYKNLGVFTRSFSGGGNLSPFRKYDESEIVGATSYDSTGGFYTCSNNNASAAPQGLVNGGEFTVSQTAFHGLVRPDINEYGKLDRIQASYLLSPSFDVGSTWGTKITDKIREVAFKRATTSVDLVIYYASRASLEQFGIDFSRTKQVFTWPSAFEDKKSYCKVPPGYEGRSA